MGSRITQRQENQVIVLDRDEVRRSQNEGGARFDGWVSVEDSDRRSPHAEDDTATAHDQQPYYIELTYEAMLALENLGLRAHNGETSTLVTVVVGPAALQLVMALRETGQ